MIGIATSLHAVYVMITAQKREADRELLVTPPDGQLKHELLNGTEEEIDSRQAGCDDHVTCRLWGHKGVPITISSHPGAKIEQVVVQWQHRLANLHACHSV